MPLSPDIGRYIQLNITNDYNGSARGAYTELS
jgi:hypothetical protein